MKYPILYAKNETDFFSLGLGVMTNTLEASVTEERNGSFYFESKIIIDVVIYPQLENDQLIKVDAGHELKDQRFRIKRIVDNHNGTASIYAEHISYLSSELSLKPEVNVSGNGSTALTIWKSSLMGANSFVVDSDITTSNSTKWRIDKVQNARQALGGVEGSILEKWGGEYRFDNYHISLLSKRGTTADVLLAYGRNITDFEQERNIANTFNSVYPYAIYTDDKQQERLITLSDYFVDSTNIASFPNRKAQTVDFSNEFEHDVVPTQDKLKSLAQKYIKANGIGVPTVSIKVSFIDLSKTSDYENIAPLEQLNLCDEVRVVYPKLKVDTTAKIVRVVWNVLSESYDEIEIGEKRVSLSDKISEQTKFINEVKTSANAALVSANGKNTNFYGLFGQDGKGEPKATKVGDLWYKPNGDKSELYQWNGTVWSFIISNDWQEIFNAKLSEELAKAKKELDAALSEKDKAIKDLDNKLIINSQAISQAQTDLASNQNAIAIVKKDLATNTQDQVTLKNSLSKLDNDLKATSQEVSNATVSISTVKKEVSTANATANEAVAKADGLLTRVSKSETTISQQDGQIKLKANQTTVDSLTKRVTDNETSITQQDQVIQLKASKSSVDSLTDRTTKAESKITQMATDINLRVTKDDIVNQINISNEGVLISANKLTLDMAGNLIFNSEFSSNNFLDGWDQSGSLNSSFYESARFYTDSSGTKSQQVGFSSKDESQATTSNWKRLGQTIRGKEGVSYSASAILAATTINLDGSGIAIGLRYLDKDKSVLSNSYSKWKTDSKDELVKLEGAVAPEGTVYVRFEIITSGQMQGYATRLMLNRGDKVAPYQSSASAIYVSGNMIVDGAVTASAIASEAITSGKIAANAVTSATIAAGAITAQKIAVGAVSAENIAAGAVVSDKISSGSITSIKIAANAVTAEKISVNNLSAINGNLGTLTAGTIDAAVVTVKNLNASNITAGTLSADRIGANSITASHISISSLSALSSNIGTITAGTINASNMNIINLNANSITSGTLNAGNINVININASNIITGYLNAKLLIGDTAHLDSVDTGRVMNKIDEHLQLGSYNAAENVGQINITSRNASDVDYPGGTTIYANPFDSGERWGMRIYRNRIMPLNRSQDAALELNPYTKGAVNVRNRDQDVWLPVNASKFNVISERKFKDDIREFGNSALKIINDTTIYSYEKSGKSEIGIIADEANEALLDKGPDGNHFVDLYSYSSIAIKAIQELTEEVVQLKSKIRKMEKRYC